MEQITDQSHSKSAYLLAASKLFERASYYGFKAIIVLYLMDETINMQRESALQIYALFTTGVLMFGIVGALLGDLVLGNKKAIMIGAFLQTLGVFIMCYTFLNSFYIGIGLVLLGGGLFTPNMFSSFGKTYLWREKLLDAGFSIYYLVVNIGAALGIASIGYIGEIYGWTFGFMTAGFFMILSLLFVFLSKESKIEEAIAHKIQKRQRILNVVLAFFLMGMFWNIYEIGSFRIRDIDIAFFDDDVKAMFRTISTKVNSYLFIPIGIILTAIWTYYYSNPLIKLSIGFMFGAAAYGILMFIPEVPLDSHAPIFVTSLFCLCIAETFIGPILMALITKYSHPKYLAITGSLMFLPHGLFSIVMYFSGDALIDNSSYYVKYYLIAMAVISLGLLFLSRTKRESKHFITIDSLDN